MALPKPGVADLVFDGGKCWDDTAFAPSRPATSSATTFVQSNNRGAILTRCVKCIDVNPVKGNLLLPSLFLNGL